MNQIINQVINEGKENFRKDTDFAAGKKVTENVTILTGEKVTIKSWCLVRVTCCIEMCFNLSET